MFTQEQVDKFAAEARKSARSAAVGDLLKELGLEKADDLKTVVKEHKDLKAATLNDQQKATQALADKEKALAEREGQLKASRAELATVRLKGLVGDEAEKLGFHKQGARDAYALLDLSQIEVGEDGKAKGIDVALKALLKDRPWLLAANVRAPGGGTNIDATNRGAGGDVILDDKAEAEMKQRYGIRN
jgi:hypothetical protein